MSDVGCGMWDVGCGMWDVGCGVWGVGCGMWDVGCGMWDVRCAVCAGVLVCLAAVMHGMTFLRIVVLEVLQELAK